MSTLHIRSWILKRISLGMVFAIMEDYMPMKEGYFKPCCFHGSGQPDINNFILGVQGVGELEVPLNCIWVTTSYGNARAFVNLTLKPRRGLLRGFIYPVELPSSCIVADTKDPDALSKFHADLIINSCLNPIQKMWYVAPTWLGALWLNIKRKGLETDTDVKNEIFRVLKSAGVGALMNPLFNWQVSSKSSSSLAELRKLRYDTQHFDDPDGVAIAVLDACHIYIQDSPIEL